MLYRGIVQKGERRATALGFPTANLPFTGAEGGIYAAYVVLDGKKYHAAVYADQSRKLLEAHLESFFGGDLYGKEIQIELLKKIRDDEKFENDQSLREAITRDIQAVRSYFHSYIH